MPDPKMIDARGLLCPMPVLKLEKCLDGIVSGTQVILLTDDPVARVDVPVLCEKRGYSYKIADADGYLKFTITKN